MIKNYTVCIKYLQKKTTYNVVVVFVIGVEPTAFRLGVEPSILLRYRDKL